MINLKWSSDDNSWATMLNNSVFDELEICVITDGESDFPTPKQVAIIESIRQLTKADLEAIAATVRQWVEDNWDAESLDELELEEEDYEYEIHSVIVPRLRDAESEYFIFTGRSEVEPKHGLGCICKNGKQFTICHPHHGFEHFGWDSVSQLEALLS
ncbi:MAG: hypothetical protein ACKVH8_07070 [Pirellulales bacterium]